MRANIMFSLAVAAVVVAAPHTAHAYIGPGAGITAIGTVIALVGVVVLGVVGFVWYPIKRLLRRKDGPEGISEEPSTS